VINAERNNFSPRGITPPGCLAPFSLRRQVMLYIQDQYGAYLPAPKEAVLSEARRLSGSQLRRGVSIKSSAVAKAAIQHRLANNECEMFACLFLDSGHRVLA